MKTQTKVNDLRDIKHGDFVTAIIRTQSSFPIAGRIISDGKGWLYFLQNACSGGRIQEKNIKDDQTRNWLKEYKCSWVFQKLKHAKGNRRYTEGVSILSIVEDPAEIKRLSTPPKQSTRVYIEDNRVYCSVEGKGTLICAFSPHPDCCGATLLYGFCESDTAEYSRYKNIPADAYSEIKLAMAAQNNTGKIAHLASYQTEAQELLLNIGFARIHSYLNVKSGNHIFVYALDPVEELDSSVSVVDGRYEEEVDFAE